MNLPANIREKIKNHPCYSEEAHHHYARMHVAVASAWSLGDGFIPNWLGLAETEFECMMQTHFPGFDHAQIVSPGRSVDLQRIDEMSDLRKLLIENRTGLSPSEIWMIEIVVADCLGNYHLWEDLGLWYSGDLSKLMLENFEPLA